MIDAPVQSCVPALGFADGADRSRYRGVGVVAVEHATDFQLEAQESLVTSLRADIPRDASIALEAALGVDDRLSADTEVPFPEVRIAAKDQQISKRQPGITKGAVLIPRAVDRRTSEIPRGLAEEVTGIVIRPARVPVTEQREPVLLVLLPVPVEREIDYALQPLFAVAQHLLDDAQAGTFRSWRATRRESGLRAHRNS